MALKKLAEFLGITEAEAQRRLNDAKLGGDEAASLAEVFGLSPQELPVPVDGRVGTDKIQTGLGKLSKAATPPKAATPSQPVKPKRKYTKRGDK